MPIPAQRVQAGPPYADTVVPLHSDQALELALFPWRGQAARHDRAKLILAIVDLAVLGLCLLVGLLPLWLGESTRLQQTQGAWWSVQGQIWLVLSASISVGMVAWMGAVYGHYTAARRKPWWDELRQVLAVIAVASMANAVVNYLGNWPISGFWTGLSWAMVFVLLPLARYSVRRQLLAAGLLTQPYVLVGHPQDLPQAAAALASEPLMGYTLAAVVCPLPLPQALELGGRNLAPIALSTGAYQYLAQPGGYQVVAVLPEHNGGWLRDFAQDLMLTRDDITIVPALNGLPMLGMEVSHFFSHEVLLLRARNNLNRRGAKLLKRGFDILGSAVLLLLLSPMFAYLAWRISLDGGSAFFGHERIGQDGKPFKCYKFRSMVMNAKEVLEHLLATDPLARAEWERDFKLKNDPRIHSLGHFLRKSSIDELPQLWNVIKGDMSLVGPRPVVKDELSRYGKHVSHYLKAKPGMTGLWQVSGRSDTDYATRVYFDAWYVKNWSLWYDIVILIRTISVVLNQSGAR
ncbi:MAG: undecaprenyl-phosphate galactose phosphotransferase WbaP [Hydrogenophaga sp.]|nr:undecaprenyl-phosphate galactose phosphotransferase WbaP [Hydrogenophaga sp.]